MVLDGFGRVWKGLEGFGRVWKGWGGVGRGGKGSVLLGGGIFHIYFFQVLRLISRKSISADPSGVARRVRVLVLVWCRGLGGRG